MLSSDPPLPSPSDNTDAHNLAHHHAPPQHKSKTALAANTELDSPSVAKAPNSVPPQELENSPSSPLSPLDPTPTSVPKTSSSQTSTPLPTKPRSPSPPPEVTIKSKTARLPREPSTSADPSPCLRSTTTHPRDNTPPAKMERVPPKPELELKFKTTLAPRPIFHAPAVALANQFAHAETEIIYLNTKP